MARFYASIRGNRGEATRMGTPSSGMYGHVRGWQIGGAVSMHARDDGEHERDTAVLTLTGGSMGPSYLGVEIAAFQEEQTGETRYVVRLPGNVEVRGYVGDTALTVVGEDGQEIMQVGGRGGV